MWELAELKRRDGRCADEPNCYWRDDSALVAVEVHSMADEKGFRQSDNDELSVAPYSWEESCAGAGWLTASARDAVGSAAPHATNHAAQRCRRWTTTYAISSPVDGQRRR